MNDWTELNINTNIGGGTFEDFQHNEEDSNLKEKHKLDKVEKYGLEEENDDDQDFDEEDDYHQET